MPLLSTGSQSLGKFEIVLLTDNPCEDCSVSLNLDGKKITIRGYKIYFSPTYELWKLDYVIALTRPGLAKNKKGSAEFLRLVVWVYLLFYFYACVYPRTNSTVVVYLWFVGNVKLSSLFPGSFTVPVCLSTSLSYFYSRQ